MSPELGVTLLVAFLLVQGFFAGAETALLRAHRGRLAERADEGHAGARVALDLLAREDLLLSTCRVGGTLALVAGASLTVHLMLAWSDRPEGLATLLFAPVALTFGKALPKAVLARHADALAPRLAPPLRAVQWVATPFVALLSAWARALDGGVPERAVRRQDVVELLHADQTGEIAPEDRQLIRRIFAITELTVESCMTPLVDVHALSEDATVGEAIDLVIAAGHGRLPVYRERIDDIVGMVHHRDLLFGADEREGVGRLVRPVRYVPDSKRADELLREMRRDGDHFAVVVDEYGGSVGVVTIEDILEQIIGDISDEREPEAPDIRRLGDREWRLPARAEIEEVEEAVGRSLPRGDYETIAGLILAASGRVPQPGETVRVDAFTFHVEAASPRALQSVRLTLDA